MGEGFKCDGFTPALKLNAVLEIDMRQTRNKLVVWGVSCSES